MKKILTLFSLIFALAAILAVAAVADDLYSDYSASFRYGREGLASMENGEAYVAAYDSIDAVVKAAVPGERAVLDTKLTVEESALVFSSFINDNPQYFWLSNEYAYSVSAGGMVSSILPSFTDFGGNLSYYKNQFTEKADDLLRAASPEMNEYEKALALHNVLCGNVSYIEYDNSHNAFGAIYNGIAVCEGYARGYQYLLGRAGIESFVVTGESLNPVSGAPEPHAWNCMKIDGKYYYTDVTWDDQSPVTFHAYFCTDYAHISRDHAFTILPYALPAADSLDAFYFTVEGGYITEGAFDAAEMSDMLKKNARIELYSDSPSFSAEFGNWYEFNYPELINSTFSYSGSFNWNTGMSYLGGELQIIISPTEGHTVSHNPEESMCFTDETLDDVSDVTMGTVVYLEGKPSGECFSFDHWEVVSGNAVIENPTLENTWFYMPYEDVEIKPVYYADHLWLEHIEEVLPTCTAKGHSAYDECLECGYKSEYTVYPALGHDYVTIEAKAPTCISVGWNEYRTCSRCTYSEYAELPVTEHDFGPFIETLPATVENEGKETRECSFCHITEERPIPKLNHEHDYCSVEAKEPTCTEAGWTAHEECSICGEKKNYTPLSPVSHKFNHYDEKEPTCLEDGWTEYDVCINCGFSTKTTLTASGHSYVHHNAKAPTCTEAGYDTYDTCLKCDYSSFEELPPLDHDYSDEWTTDVEPTYDFEGSKSHHCIRCGDKKDITPIPKKEKPKENPFKDVKEKDYFFSPVMWAVEKGVTSGMTPNTFEPNSYCTRGQIVTFLWRAAGQPEPEALSGPFKDIGNPFKDVKEKDFFYKAVLWAVEKEITKGMTETTFAPNAVCTRGQTVTFLWRAKGSPKSTADISKFRDVKKNEYYSEAVAWAVETGVTSGMSATTFEPNSKCTRGQIVTFLSRAYS